MCIICGNIDHQGADLLIKALKNKRGKIAKEQPRYKALKKLEDNFKQSYINNISTTLDEIVSSVKQMEG